MRYIDPGEFLVRFDLHALFFRDFETAGHAVLAFLHQRLGFDLWMITRTEGEDWIVLQREDQGYGVEPGSVFRWRDSFCSEMVKGNGPRIAPRSEAVPAYVAAPIGHQVPIQAYVGTPLVHADGSLFGTLCAIHPSPQPESIVGEQALVELLGAMLSTLLQTELRAAAETRRAEQLEAEAMTDTLTGLYNRQGWNRLLAAEEDRCRRYGHPAAVLVINLDASECAGTAQDAPADEALRLRASVALQEAARTLDIVARLDEAEFGILAAECDREGANALVARVREALENAHIPASVGVAMRRPSNGLLGAWDKAGQRLRLD